MFKIDNSTANPLEPLRTADGPNPGGAFDATLETIVTDEWLNAVQNELANVALESGMALDKQSDTQVSDAINARIAMMAANNWTKSSNPKAAGLRAIAYGNGVVVAVGSSDGADAYIVTSVDGGNTWTERVNPKTAQLNDITFATGTFVAVGNADGADAYILTSADNGVTWTERVNTKNVSLSGIASGNNVFVAVGSADGADAYILTSADNGVTWVERANPQNASLQSVAYNSDAGVFVAVGQPTGTGSYILRSSNGTVWSQIVSADMVTINGVAHGNGVFVAAGSILSGSVYIIVSSDAGLTWTRAPTDNSFFAGAQEVRYGNGIFIVVGGLLPDGQALIATSAAGIAWKLRSSRVDDVLQGVIFAGDHYIAVGNDDGAEAAILTSLSI